MKITRSKRLDFMVAVGGTPEKRTDGWWYLPKDWIGCFTGPHKTIDGAIDAALLDLIPEEHRVTPRQQALEAVAEAAKYVVGVRLTAIKHGMTGYADRSIEGRLAAAVAHLASLEPKP